MRTFPVERVVDGDTFVVRYDAEPTYVRPYGFDAPEPSEAHAQEATAALREMIEGKMVRLAFPGPGKRDNFGGLLCRVTAGGVDVGGALLRSGHATKRRGR